MTKKNRTLIEPALFISLISVPLVVLLSLPRSPHRHPNPTSPIEELNDLASTQNSLRTGRSPIDLMKNC